MSNIISGTIDNTFNVGTGFNSPNNLWIKSDSYGKLYITGQITEYNGVTLNTNFIRLNADGTIDSTFNMGSGFNSSTWQTCIQSDGKIIVSGGFTEYSGVTANRLIRLNNDGSIDTDFLTNLGSGFNQQTYDITLQSDGKILVTGIFTDFNGNTCNGITRLNSDGTIDTGFLTNIGTAFGGTPFTIKVLIDDNNKILIGGYFTTWDGNSVGNGLIRLDINGNLDTSITGAGFNDTVKEFSIQPDGKIICVGSDFSEYNGTSANRIIRLNNDFSIDTSFVYGTAFNGIVVFGSYLQRDGKIIVSGNFDTYNGETVPNDLIRLNSNGSLDNSFNKNGTGGNQYISGVLLTSDDKIIIVGNFTQYNDEDYYGIVRLFNSVPEYANTEVTICMKDCSGNTITITPPHPTFLNEKGKAVVQLNLIQLGGQNGLYS